MKVEMNGWELIEVIISQWKVRGCVLCAQRIFTQVFFFEADLHQIIKSGQALTSEHIQYFVYQILRGRASTEVLTSALLS